MNKKLLIVIGISIAFVVLVGGSVVMVKNFLAPSSNTNVEPTPMTDNLPTIDPSVIVDLKLRSDGHAVSLNVSNIPADVASIEYELSYTTGDGLPKGALSGRPLDINAGERTFSREILMGTCSKDKCVYDQGVTKIFLVLKFNSPKGTSQFQKDFSF